MTDSPNDSLQLNVSSKDCLLKTFSPRVTVSSSELLLKWLSTKWLTPRRLFSQVTVSPNCCIQSDYIIQLPSPAKSGSSNECLNMWLSPQMSLSSDDCLSDCHLGILSPQATVFRQLTRMIVSSSHSLLKLLSPKWLSHQTSVSYNEWVIICLSPQVNCFLKRPIPQMTVLNWTSPQKTVSSKHSLPEWLSPQLALSSDERLRKWLFHQMTVFSSDCFCTWLSPRMNVY